MSADQNVKHEKFLTMENLSQAVKNVDYAVYGKTVARAVKLEKELKQGVEKPFDKVIRANVGDCHAVGQKPLTFVRQVMALCAYPKLFDDPRFADDAKQRARRFLDACAGQSVGSYSDSAGIECVREDIAKFIEKRDGGVPCNVDDIFLCTGASTGIKNTMKLLLSAPGQKPSGFMIPIPQYPLYSATISEYNAFQIGYYLDEDNNWALDTNELERAYNESLSKCDPRAICIINPGNPTGQVLSLENIKSVIRWAYSKRLFIIADEVYQDNVYAEGMQFHSFKKVAHQLGYPYTEMEIASFYSTSKGFAGECGARGGYFEVVNMQPEVKAELKKLMSAQLCSSLLGQAVMDTVVNPPQPGEPSHDQFVDEKEFVLNGLKEKAMLVTNLFNSIEGVKCNPVQGSMYAFPQVMIPARAVAYAQSQDMTPDLFYCLELVEATGICVVPGSGFHQRPGTYHFRTTILPPVDQIKSLLEKYAKFHMMFMKKWQ